MTVPSTLLSKGLRYLKRWVMLPHSVTETLVRLRSMESTLTAPPRQAPLATPAIATALPVTPGEVYQGYSAADLWVFDLFSDARPEPAPGFVTDFLGTRTRTSSLWDAARAFDGQVMSRPVPHDLFEAIEWIGLLKAVASARGGRFAMMELGAGWGPWLAAGAVAARHRGIASLKLLGVEADPGRFALMQQHFRDNGLDPEAHRLICAAVGVEAGHARWPRIGDPANAGGARPVRQEGVGLDAADTAYMQGQLDDHVEVRIVPLAGLLEQEPVWDLVHVDVQGWEATLCSGAIEALNTRARWLIVGTHSRVLDGRMIDILHTAGWVLENEKPTRFQYEAQQPSLELMTQVDGAQIWRNPRLP
jgi:FkbM family methyltransferase